MTYFSTVLADAPLEWWRLADGGGSLFSNIGSDPARRPLYSQLPGSLPYTGPSSDGGAGFFFTGTHAGNSRATVALPAGSTSIEVWAFELDVTGVQNLFVQTLSGTKLFQLDHTAGGSMEWDAHGAPNNWLVGAAASVNQWHHVVGTYDGATARLWVDGVNVASTAVATDMSGNHQIFLAQTSGGTGSNVLLSDLAIYTTVLSGARILAHFNAADQANTLPVFRGVGSGLGATGVPLAQLSDLADVLRSVRKTF